MNVSPTKTIGIMSSVDAKMNQAGYGNMIKSMIPTIISMIPVKRFIFNFKWGLTKRLNAPAKKAPEKSEMSLPIRKNVSRNGSLTGSVAGTIGSPSEG